MVGRIILHPKDVHVLSSGCVSMLLQMKKKKKGLCNSCD